MSEPCNRDCATCLPVAFDFAAKRAAVQVTVSEADGVHVAQIVVPDEGTYVPQHSHIYDHTTMLAVGSMRVWVEGELVGDFTAPCPITIPAAKKHTFLALTDNVIFYCIHNIARTGRVQELDRHELPGYAPPDLVLAETDDGMKLVEEKWDQFWGDAQILIAEHSKEIGPREGVSLQVNEEVFERLDRNGALQIVTARSNGRMFGYLISIVSPSLENPALRIGTQTSFFVTKDLRGLGPKMMRASLERMKEKGVHEVIFRAGVRGNGPKAAALYRRLGAKPFGELFALQMEPT